MYIYRILHELSFHMNINQSSRTYLSRETLDEIFFIIWLLSRKITTQTYNHQYYDIILLYTVWSGSRHFTIHCMKRITSFYYTLYEADYVILLYTVWSGLRHFTIHCMKRITSFYYTLYEADYVILLYIVWSGSRHFTIHCMKRITSFYYILYEVDHIILIYTVWSVWCHY